MSNFSGDRKYTIPVLEPFDVKEVQIINGGDRPTGISITLRNAKVYGIKDTVVKKTT
jgi:molybdate-binding protein